MNKEIKKMLQDILIAEKVMKIRNKEIIKRKKHSK